MTPLLDVLEIIHLDNYPLYFPEKIYQSPLIRCYLKSLLLKLQYIQGFPVLLTCRPSFSRFRVRYEILQF